MFGLQLADCTVLSPFASHSVSVHVTFTQIYVSKGHSLPTKREILTPMHLHGSKYGVVGVFENTKLLVQTRLFNQLYLA
jgi:hypothetical protein